MTDRALVSAAIAGTVLALYLDIFNVFQSLLALLGIMGGERD